MDRTSVYIQKLIIFILVSIIGIALSEEIKIYYLLPALFFTFAFLVSRVTGQKPDYLFGLAKSDEFLEKKAGFWMLFKWILMLAGLVYDMAAWTIFGMYLLFMLILDFISLVKQVIYWVIHAILWFLKLFVPAIVFVYKMVIYYVFRWNWWIYKLSYRNIRISLNRNFYFISLWGAVLMSFVILLFYGVGLLMGSPEIVVLGAVFSVLPLVWSYGEISSLRMRKAAEDDYPRVRANFGSGFDAVRAVLGYFVIFLFLAFLEVLMNLLGWIPVAGFSFMGLALNINTFASLLLLFVFVILVFVKLVMPPHVVYNRDFTSNFNNSLVFLGVIGKRFLRYIFSAFSSGFFGLIISLIPVAIVFLSVMVTLKVKDSILETRIDILEQRANVLEGIEKYKTNREIGKMEYFMNFPQNIIPEFRGMKSMKNSIGNLNENIARGEEEITRLTNEFNRNIDSLDRKIAALKASAISDSLSVSELSATEELRKSRMEGFSDWKKDATLMLEKKKVDLSDRKGMLIQLPIVFFLSIIWASFFAGLVLAFIISYLGNIYFELYNFKEDNKITYFSEVARSMKKADRNQPLLAFTLLVLVILSVNYFDAIVSMVSLFFIW